MEIVRQRSTRSEVVGAKPIITNELLGLLPDRTGVHPVKDGIFAGENAVVVLANIRPNKGRRTDTGIVWDATLEIPHWKTRQAVLTDAEKRLLELGIVPVQFSPEGKAELRFGTGDMSWKFTLDRAIMGPRIVLERKHGGLKQVETRGHAERYPDWPGFDIGLTVPNYRHRVVTVE